MTSVKWLESIEVIDYHFKGYQHKSYAMRKTIEEEGEEVKYIQVRALIVPPGSTECPPSLTGRIP